MPRITALDPGTTQTGMVVLTPGGDVAEAVVLKNHLVLERLARLQEPGTLLAIEWVSSYGMAVGREVFETCRWVGRFQQAWHASEAVQFLTRSEIKLALCRSARAKDPNIRAALIDLFQPTGGGTCPQIGTSRKRGPLYGVHTHAWSALAVAVVAGSRMAAASSRPVPAFMGQTALERFTEEPRHARVAPTAEADNPFL